MVLEKLLEISLKWVLEKILRGSLEKNPGEIPVRSSSEIPEQIEGVNPGRLPGGIPRSSRRVPRKIFERKKKENI